MGLFYKVSNKELLAVRNRIIKEIGIPQLIRNGFEPDPYKTSWHGEYNRSIKGYIYQFSRIKRENYLERLVIYVVNGERWIQVYLDIFELEPGVFSLSVLKNIDGIKFSLPPINSHNMRLRCDDYKGPPLFYMFFSPVHKLGKFQTRYEYNKAVRKLQTLIQADFGNIDSFVKRWHELHTPFRTDWEGNKFS